MSEVPRTVAFVGIGSNLDGPEAQVARAVATLGQIAQTRVLACSSLYRSAPFGEVEQPDFVNAVAKIETGLSVTELLRQLQAIETGQGRVRGRRWGPRVIDLDLLQFGR